jgi:hypothetical protein
MSLTASQALEITNKNVGGIYEYIDNKILEKSNCGIYYLTLTVNTIIEILNLSLKYDYIEPKLIEKIVIDLQSRGFGVQVFYKDFNYGNCGESKFNGLLISWKNNKND